MKYQDQNQRIFLQSDLIKLYEEYIALLGEELNDLIGLVLVHGWKSSRVDQGIEMRDKIQTIKDQIK